MDCSQCRAANPPEARFCGRCGASLVGTLACESCGQDNPVDNRFCNGCGRALAALQAEEADQSSAPVPALAAQGERRQLTVLFCDLVGSTRLSGTLDAEYLRELMTVYHELCADVVERFDGHVAQYLGDGLLVYFGYPHAHEDSAARAIEAALAIPPALADIDARSGGRVPRREGAPLAVRIAIHTGPVVVGETGGGPTRERLAMGQAVNIAARLQSFADPDAVVISETTRRLVEGFFVLEDLGERLLRGVDRPLRAYRVVRSTGLGSRLDAGARAGLTPFVGRQQELAYLVDRFEQTLDGLGQAVLISGDAGVGKSRLVRELSGCLGDQPHTWLEARGSPHHTNSAFHPVIDLIHRGIDLNPDDTPPARADRLRTALHDAGLAVERTFPLFASLLSLDVPDADEALTQSAEARRQRTLEALVAWMFALAERQPVILVMEDLQWVDASTLELLSMLVDQAPTARVLTLPVARSEFRPPWTQQSHVTQLTLTPLTRHQARTMIGRVAGEKPLPDEVVEQLISKCDGVPLYLEELTKAVLESDLLREGAQAWERADPLPELAIPESLKDSLMARLDRLGSAKEVAQLASVLGRDFPHALLAAVAQMDEAPLTAAMDSLAAAQILYHRGVPPRASYVFKHALIQETAYQSLLRSRRIELHAQVAHVLEESFSEVARSEPEVVAHHYAQAARIESVDYYRRAGELAKERMANVEAIGHLERAIELLSKAPETAHRNREELRLQVALGAPLIATRGYADEYVRRAFERARELCDQVGEAGERFEAVYGYSAYCLNTTDMKRSHELSEELLELAGQIPGPSRLPWAHQQMGCVFYFGGDPAPASEHFDKTVAAFDDEHHRIFLHVFGQDPTVAGMALGGMTRWLLGYADDAIASSRAAIERAREIKHPFSLGFALCFCGYNHVQRREPELASEVGRETVALAREQALSQWEPYGRSLIGWGNPDPEQGIAQIETCLTDAATLGSRIGAPFVIGMLIDRQLDAGLVDVAGATIDYALKVSEETQNRFWDAELHRLCGDVESRRSDGSVEKAMSHYTRANEIARDQGARSLELRAAVSLACLLAERGERERAQGLLTPIYAWFEQGKDTADLRAAAELTAKLEA